ncbi:DUF1573 domain-containing protein [Candidatus Latescibacterota bacterium]
MVKKILSIALLLLLLIHFSVAENIKQSNYCGPNSLFIITKYFNANVLKDDIFRFSDVNREFGTTLLSLYEASKNLGLPVVPVKTNLHGLCLMNAPAIAFVDGNHFLVVHDCGWTTVTIEDPPKPKQKIPKKEFEKRWKGEALVFSEKLYKKQVEKIEKSVKPPNGPKIAFNQNTIFFGSVREGEKITNTFTFTNIGSDTLEVSARSTCSCTTALLSKSKIPPGGTGQIKLEFDTKGQSGQVIQGADIRTNDPANPWEKLTLEGTVQVVSVFPNRHWLDEVTKNATVIREVLVIDTGDSTLAVVQVKTPQGVSAKVLRSRKENGSCVVPVSFTIKPGTTPGDFEKKVTIVTNDSSKKTLDVTFAGKVLGDLKALPSMLFFGDVIADFTTTREIILIPTNGLLPKIERAISSSPYISTEVQEIEDGSNYKLVATLNSPKSDMTIRDNIPIYINGEKEPAIEIPVYARVVGTLE